MTANLDTEFHENISHENYGYVYCMTNKYMPTLCKIGFVDTKNKTPFDRARELSAHTNCPVPFEVIFYIKVKNPYKYEKRIHSKIKHLRVNKRREFFDCFPRDITQYFDKNYLVKFGEEHHDFAENYFVKHNLVVNENVDKNVGKNVDENVDKNVDKNVNENVDKNVNENVDKNVDKNVNKNVDKNVNKNVELVELRKNKQFDKTRRTNLNKNIVFGSTDEFATDMRILIFVIVKIILSIVYYLYILFVYMWKQSIYYVKQKID